jgi:hypothetical protein
VDVLWSVVVARDDDDDDDDDNDDDVGDFISIELIGLCRPWNFFCSTLSSENCKPDCVS